MEAHQRIRRGRAERQRDDGARQADDDRVDVRADSVVAKVHEDVAPVLEGRLEVDEREEDRPGVDLDGQLQRGDREPVDREQHHEAPAQ